jgi:hypothetical protein
MELDATVACAESRNPELFSAPSAAEPLDVVSPDSASSFCNPAAKADDALPCNPDTPTGFAVSLKLVEIAGVASEAGMFVAETGAAVVPDAGANAAS